MIKTRFIVAIGLLMTLACCSNSGTDQTPDPNPPTPPTPPATGDYVSVQNGKIYAPNGGELSLWGVNFQPCLSWEYNDRLKRHGIPQTAEALRRVAENNLEEVTKLKVSVIRCHLTPADFTDAEGNLVETPYLDVLDYMEKIPMVTAYKLTDGTTTTRFPMGEALDTAQPVVEYLPGWHCDITAARKWEDLPQQARDYVEYLEKAVGCKITYISVGAEREAYIHRG